MDFWGYTNGAGGAAKQEKEAGPRPGGEALGSVAVATFAQDDSHFLKHAILG